MKAIWDAVTRIMDRFGFPKHSLSPLTQEQLDRAEAVRKAGALHKTDSGQVSYRVVPQVSGPDVVAMPRTLTEDQLEEAKDAWAKAHDPEHRMILIDATTMDKPYYLFFVQEKGNSF